MTDTISLIKTIARGLYRCLDLIVLDEPTDAIDPLEETRLYEKFMEPLFSLLIA